MKRTLQIAAVSILSFSTLTRAASAAGPAAYPAVEGARVQTVSWHDEGGPRDRDRAYRGNGWQRDDGRYYDGDYAAPYPNDGNYRDSHTGRDVAIVAGSAAAGALIGGAAGHGQGAVIGGIIGGITGLIVDQTAEHHNR
ncbi:MAG: hypothetical protein JOY54_06045 [Acidobacteriaceae bacterium]|nr:hypothetical protein [Acidobacteriaceae bacterium]